ncbi:MAG: TIGR00730 family Rossman fold protein, partial [Proteobacteria bacterium]|nr:TIGR00730 family Rossman fold protein [Pseudomonadota bacterium]
APVAIFGSARTKEGTPHYELAREMGALLVDQGFSVITGGGPGIMAAANQGAMEAFRRARAAGRSEDDIPKSLSFTIKLPHEEKANPNVHRSEECDHFYPRKIGLVKCSAAIVVMPGGIGTLDEAFEVLKLSRANGMPVVFVGHSFYGALFHWLKHDPSGPGALGLISPSDLNRLVLVDTPEEAMHYIKLNCAGRVAQFEAHRERLNGTRELPEAEAIKWLLNREERTLLESPSGKAIDTTMLARFTLDLTETLAFMKQVRGVPVSMLGSSVANPQFSSEAAEAEYQRIKSTIADLTRAVIGQKFTSVIGTPSGLMGEIATVAPSHAIYACDKISSAAMRLPHPQIPESQHRYALYDFSQKVGLTKYTAGGIFVPGGFGTLDALCELQNLIMCRKMKNPFPIALYGAKFWNGFIDVLREIPKQTAEQSMKGNGYFTLDEIANLRVTDDPEEAARIIHDGYLLGRA